MPESSTFSLCARRGSLRAHQRNGSRADAVRRERISGGRFKPLVHP